MTERLLKALKKKWMRLISFDYRDQVQKGGLINYDYPKKRGNNAAVKGTQTKL